MSYVSKLTNVLSNDLPGWHKARLKFMARFVGSLRRLASSARFVGSLLKSTVNFSKLAPALKPDQLSPHRG